MSDMEIDAAGMRRSGGDLKAAAQRLEAAWNEHERQVQGMGEPWGNDDIGQLIGISYLVIHEIAQETFNSVIDGMKDHGEGAHAMADTYQDSDDKTDEKVRSVEREV
jgi:hypothetical protein